MTQIIRLSSLGYYSLKICIDLRQFAINKEVGALKKKECFQTLRLNEDGICFFSIFHLFSSQYSRVTLHRDVPQKKINISKTGNKQIYPKRRSMEV